MSPADHSFLRVARKQELSGRGNRAARRFCNPPKGFPCFAHPAPHWHCSSGINIVAIHQHMTQESPRIMFLHYWGKGKAVDLPRAVKKAVDTQKL